VFWAAKNSLSNQLFEHDIGWDMTIDDITFEQQTAMIDVHIILHP